MIDGTSIFQRKLRRKGCAASSSETTSTVCPSRQPYSSLTHLRGTAPLGSTLERMCSNFTLSILEQGPAVDGRFPYRGSAGKSPSTGNGVRRLERFTIRSRCVPGAAFPRSVRSSRSTRRPAMPRHRDPR